MKVYHKIFSGLLMTFCLACHRQQAPKPTRIPADSSIQIKASNPKKYDEGESNPLFAFVGEKIAVASFPEKEKTFDHRFKATYKVLQKLYGHFKFDTIEFFVFDHEGMPFFFKYKNVLLFVSEDSGVYYHQKYLFYDVYKTREGRWAGCYSQYDYEQKNNKRSNTKPVKINFAERVSFPIKEMGANGHLLSRIYPTPYFKTIGDSAFPVYGNYVDELFALGRDGVLTARKIFVDGKLQVISDGRMPE